MPEIVTVTPGGGRDAKGNPVPAGTPFEVMALEVAPGNMLVRYGVGGDLSTVEFTVFLPLRMRAADPVDGYVATVDRLTDAFSIEVRGRVCRGRAQVWDSGGRGGIAVLAYSATGKS